MRDVVQDVRVLFVEIDDDDVLVDCYGGPENACVSIRFTFADEDQRHRRRAQLQRWADQERSVTLVTDHGHVALVNDQSLIDRLLDPRG